MQEVIEARLTSARHYVKSAAIAKARFERDGDLEQAEWVGKYLEAVRLHCAAVVELGGAIPADLQAVVAPEVEPIAAKAAPKVRCAFYKEIRRWHAIAREMGFDISESAHDRIRGALSTFLRRRIESREDLTGSEWRQAGDALKRGELCW